MTTALMNAAQPVAASTVMALLPNRPRLLALGEPTHSEGTLLELRNELFRQLVVHEGYRTITVESDCLRGLIVNEYVTSGAGTLNKAMERGFSHGWGAEAGNRDLVRWMREYNHARPHSEQVRFAGFDGPLEMTAAASPRQAMTALHAYLAHWVDPALITCTSHTLDRLLGDDDAWTNPTAMMEPATSIGHAPQVRELRLIADDLVAVLNTQVPHLIAVTSPDELDHARLYGRTASGLLRYHFAMADSTPNRITRLCALRDQMMAQNLLALVEREPTLVHAHNSHLQRDQSTMQMGQGPVQWWSAGALLNAHLGQEYAFLATALGTIRHNGVDTPPPDTIEGLLYSLPKDRYLFDTRSITDAAENAPTAARVSPWFGYAPLDPAHLDQVDGIVYVKDVLNQQP